MRVCLVSHTADVGGAERSMVDLAEALTALAIECHVVLPYRGSLTEMLEAKRVPYSISYFRPWCWAAGQPRWDRLLKKPLVHFVRAVALARVIRQVKCDVVLTNTSTLCEGAVAARLLGIPHVTHVREFGDPGYGLNYELGLAMSMRILSALSKRVVFNSRTLAQHYQDQVPAARARVVYNAVIVPAASEGNASADCERPAADFVCLLLGNILRSKGQEDAIRAVHELVRRGRAVRLRMVGRPDPQETRRLEALINTLELGERVELIGHVADPYPYYAQADAVLVCSHKEAFGRVTVEAMKLGRPVIAASGGGTPEQIQDGSTGMLYPPGNWLALAEKIHALMLDPELAREMARRGQEWATHTFTLERYGSDMLAVLNEALYVTGEKRSPGPFTRERGLLGGVAAIAPVAIRHTRDSVLARPRTAAEFPYFVGQRPRLATCGGVAWFHGMHLATINLLGNTIATYSFDPARNAVAPLQTATRVEGLARPENLAFSPDGRLLAVTNSVGGTVVIYAVDAETHAIARAPVCSIDCGVHVNPHGVSFSPDSRLLFFSSVEHPGSLRCFRMTRRMDDTVEALPMQVLVNRYSPLRPKGVAFAPDGRFIAIAYGSNAEVKAHRDRPGFLAVYAFDDGTGCALEPLSVSGNELDLRCAEDVNFLPDGSHLVVTDQAQDTAIVVAFDRARGALGETKLTIANPAAQLSYPHGNGVSPDGRYLAVANYGDDKITVYELGLACLRGVAAHRPPSASQRSSLQAP